MSDESQTTEEVPVQDADWPYDFTKQDVDAWKHQHGEENVHLVETQEGDSYVLRGLYRKEFMDLQNGKYRNEEDLEDNFVLEAMLYPSLTQTELRNRMAALSNRLFERIVEVSNVDAGRDLEPEELTEKNLPEGVSADDYRAWKGRIKGAKLYIVEFEGQQFVYKGLRRSEYEKFRDGQREEGKNQHDSENEVCTLGIVYPFVKEFDPTSNDYLYGTIGSLAVMIMKVSGFGATSTVTKL